MKDYTFSDVSRHLEAVLDLVPWKEMAQSDFVREDVNTVNTKHRHKRTDKARIKVEQDIYKHINKQTRKLTC